MAHGGMRIYEKLDGIFCNAYRRNLYLEAQLKVLYRLDYSNHHYVLITLMDKDLRQIPKSFKFECVSLV